MSQLPRADKPSLACTDETHGRGPFSAGSLIGGVGKPLLIPMVVARRSAYTAWNSSRAETVNGEHIEQRLLASLMADRPTSPTSLVVAG